MRKKDTSFIGYKCGMLVVIGRGHTIGNSLRWKCKCDCGKTCFHTKQNILKGTLRSCGCFKQKCHGKSHKNWKGNGNVSSSFLCKVKAMANRRKIPCNLTVETMNDVLVKQNEQCALTGISLTFPETQKEHRKKKLYNASLDRKNSSKGYTPDNIQWVVKDINMMKQQMSDTDFIKMCSVVTNFQKRKKL